MTLDTEWRKQALCNKRHIDFWYPPMDADVPEKYYSIARELCHRCPVWETCLSEAVRPPVETWGMWGGLTPQERTAINNATPKPSVLRAHGSWVRYRQGCRCTDCSESQNVHLENVNMNVIPYMHESVGNLDDVRFGLLS